mgnify:CR=1 FL=1
MKSLKSTPIKPDQRAFRDISPYSRPVAPIKALNFRNFTYAPALKKVEGNKRNSNRSVDTIEVEEYYDVVSSVFLKKANQKSKK